MTDTRAFNSADLHSLEGWGGGPEMSHFEGVMWRLDVNPHMRSTMTGVEILDHAPDWQRLRAAHERLTASIPRFRQRVVEPLFGLGTPHWVDDPDFSLDYHLRRLRVPEPATPRQLLEQAQWIAMTPFDRARPPWEVILIEGLADGRAAYVLKMHHALSDGHGMMQLLSQAHSHSAQPGPPVEQPARQPAAPLPSTGAVLGRQVRAGLSRLPQQTRKLVADVAQGLQRPDAAREALRYVQSAARILGRKPAPKSPLIAGRSLSWHFDALDFPLDDFKAAAKRAGASLNDAYIAGIAGGFRRYHEQLGQPIAKLPIVFPVSVRTAADGLGGNRFVGGQFDAPLDEPDPVACMKTVGAFVETLRAEPALDVLLRVMPIVGRLPTPLLGKMMSGVTAAQDVQATNVPGLRRPVYIAGARVTHFFGFGPLPGCAAMFAMLSHDQRCCIGINTDAAAVREPDRLVECLRLSFDEIMGIPGITEVFAGPGKP